MESFDPTESIEKAKSPSHTWYTDPQFYLQERSVFEKNWMAVGRVDQLKNVGDYFTGEVLGNPFLVTKTESNKLKAFHNVCRHKAHPVAIGDGNCDNFICPYHGWTYNIDGKIKKTPHLGKIDNFCPKDFSLKECAIESWGPFLFIDLDAYWNNEIGLNKRDLHKDFNPISTYLNELGVNEMKFYERRVYDMNCNWKVFVENSLDGGYHVSYTHENLASGLEFSGYKTEIFERASVQICDTSNKDVRLGSKVVYAWLFPNFFINRYGHMMDTNYVIPLGVDKCRVVFDFYFDYDNFDSWINKKLMKKSIEDSEAIQEEDIEVCEASQKGMGSMSFDYGKYSSKLEKAVHAFHVMLWRELN